MSRYNLENPPLPGTSTRVIAAFWQDWRDQASPKIRADFKRRGIVVPEAPTRNASTVIGESRTGTYAEFAAGEARLNPPPSTADPAVVAHVKKLVEGREAERRRLHPCSRDGWKPDRTPWCGLDMCWITPEPRK